MSKQETPPVVIITGATGNLGQATATTLARAGSRLVLVARDQVALEALAAQLASQTGAEIKCFALDLLDAPAVAAMAAEVMARYGQLDALIHLVGGFRMGPPLHQTPDEDWQGMLDLNARTLLHGVRAATPHLIASGGGRIVTVSARAARPGRGFMAPYSAAKAAVIALTESLAEELKDAGISVNCILPGTVDTPDNRAAMPDQDPATWVTPEALADVIAFLASPAARAITGAAIPVYGRG
ncbi:MAG: SDR family oxidoreductase [Chromatiaceae bacterium]|nr:SDR family oxidoreductase [Chromatiaceae bacterium]